MSDLRPTDLAGFMEAMGREVATLEAHKRELAAQLADLRIDVAAAAQLLEATLRRVGVSEVRLWGSPWRTGLSGNVVSVTLSLRDGKGEVHGETLEDAVGKALRP